MNNQLVIRGAKGGKGGGGGTRAAVEAPDSLRSIQYARVLDLVSEGEIGGLVAGAQSVYLDNTPLQNPDETFNFSGVTLDSRTGTQAQDYLPGFPAAESENVVNVEVKNSAAVTRQISNANTNNVSVTLTFPQLTSQNTTTGDLNGTSVDVAIDLQASGGAFVEQIADTVSGKTTTRYQRSYEITLAGSAPWNIRVRRVTADSTSSALVNKSWWASYTEIIDSKLTYPNSAIIGLEIDASQFNNVPVRGYDLRGLLVQVPINYNPTTRIYTGVWNGTFQTAWSDNPAWCYYDMLTTGRYGLGDYIDPAAVDKWALYEIAQYCDEFIADGFGEVEPRFTCNLYLQTRQEAYKVLANMASIFRGMAFWSAGAVTATADMPADPVALYAAANVIDGQFSYSGSAKNTRHTVALVQWNDPEDAFKQKIEYVEDATGIARYGVNESQVVAFGCTSRGQAHRVGRWLLYSERLETETITFSVGLDGVLSPPGSIIQVQDQFRAGVRYGGRIVSATVSTVTLDQAVTLAAGRSYALSAVLPDGSVQERPVINSKSTTATLGLANAFDQAPQVAALWVLRSDVLEATTWRVLALTETEKARYTITALAHNPDKFDAVENNLILEPTAITTLTSRPAAPINLAVTESLYEAGPGLVGNRVLLSWSGDTGRYSVAYRATAGNWVTLADTVSQTIDIDGLAPGRYTFTVQQINALGLRSSAGTLDTAIYGKLAAPADVSGFTVIKSSGLALAQWTLPADLDVQIGGFVVVRHSAKTTGATWQDGVILDAFPGGIPQGLCALITGTYMAKALDSSGNYSATMASFVATEGMLTGFTTVGTITESPSFTGTKTNLSVSASTLSLASGTLFDSVAGNFDDVSGLFDSVGGQALTGSYAFSTYLDLATSATRRFEADITALMVDNSQTWDEQPGNMDDISGLFDGAVINDCDLTLYAATTDDNPAGSPTWSGWMPFFVAEYTCRAMKFKLDFISGTTNHNINVTALTVHAKTANF